MQKNETAFRSNWARWIKKYPGRYIAVVDGKVSAVASSRLRAFRKIEKQLPPQKEVGLFYIPSPKQYPMVLHAISLIDSGADLSLFDASVAEALGIDHQKGTKLRITVGDGDQITAHRYQLLVQFSRYTFKAPICFSTALGSGFNLLGRSGFFEKFRICFHEKQAFVSINRI